MKRLMLFVFFSAAVGATRLDAAPFTFTTGSPDGRLATASRPGSPANIEIESADDFIITNSPTRITTATFTGLLPTGTPLGSIQQVVVEIYRVFPNDSDVGQTFGPPTFSTIQVPTRVNSPSDVAFALRDSLTPGDLNVSENILNPAFTAANSILNGINKLPNVTTGGEGPVTGEEVQFNVSFTKLLSLPADHYFFVPQVQLSSGDFFWLSVAGPPLFTDDLQAWIRNANLDPDWLREGTDIVGGTPALKFNEAFSIAGTVPDAGSTELLLSIAAVAMFYLRRRVCSATIR